MYRDSGAGKDPIPPALPTVVDLRWQLVLDRLGSDQPAFWQGALTDFRSTGESPRGGSGARPSG